MGMCYECKSWGSCEDWCGEPPNLSATDRLCVEAVLGSVIWDRFKGARMPAGHSRRMPAGHSRAMFDVAREFMLEHFPRIAPYWAVHFLVSDRGEISIWWS